MPWKPLNAFTDSLKGKYVRFVAPHGAANLSRGFGINTTNERNVRILVGAIGKVYESRGGTLFIGFSKDLRTPPPSHYGATQFAATIQFYISDIDKIEVDAE